MDIDSNQPMGASATPSGYSFSVAIDMIKQGRKVYRSGWNGKGQYLEMQVPDTNSKMKRSYIFISPVDGNLVPWVASQSDLLAEDWYEIVI